VLKDKFNDSWFRTTEREKEILKAIVRLTSEAKYAIAGIPTQSIIDEIKEKYARPERRGEKKSLKPPSGSQVSQILLRLVEEGLIAKQGYGQYSLSMPMVGDYIRSIDAFGVL